MNDKEKNQFEVGKWYKDKDGDFIKFYKFDDNFVDFVAKVRDGKYDYVSGHWNKNVFTKCIPMTIDEMKQYLPEREWWVEPNNELFPIY